MSTLITGGTGFVGAQLARLLIDRGERPVLMDVARLRGDLAELGDSIEYVRGSVTNLSEILNALSSRKVNRIFHLAGMLSLPSEANPWAAFDVNAVGTYNALEAARLLHVETVVFSSSIAVYSDDLPEGEITEREITKPRTMYGTCKVFGELLGRFYSRRFGMDFRGLRLPSVVGPFAETVHMSSYNCLAIEEPLKGREYALPVAPEIKTPAIYYKDAAHAMLLLAEADRKDILTMVYNVAGITPSYTANDLVNAVRKRIPAARLTFEPDPQVTGLLKEIGLMEISDRKAQDEWGWKINYDLEAMVDDFVSEFDRRNRRSVQER